MQGGTGPHGVHAAGFVVFVPGAAVFDPDGMPDPFLDMIIEGVGDILPGGDGADVFGLQFADQLEGVEGDLAEWSHHGTILDRPGRTDEG